MDKDLFNQKLNELKQLYSDQYRASDLVVNIDSIEHEEHAPQTAIFFFFPFRFEQKRYLASELLQFHDEIIYNFGNLYITIKEAHKVKSFKSLKLTEKLEFYKTNQFCSPWYFGEFNNSLKFIELFIKEICFFPSENFQKYFEPESNYIKEINNFDAINYFFNNLYKDKKKYSSHYNFNIHNLLFFLFKNDVKNFIRLLDSVYTLFLYFIINYNSNNPKLSFSEQIDSKVLKTLEEALGSLEPKLAKAELIFIAKDFSSLVQFLKDQERWFYEESLLSVSGWPS